MCLDEGDDEEDEEMKWGRLVDNADTMPPDVDRFQDRNAFSCVTCNLTSMHIIMSSFLVPLGPFIYYYYSLVVVAVLSLFLFYTAPKKT